MSYILNALRKSEKERLAQQPDTVADRILVGQPQPRHKTSKIIILLFISNVIIAALFFWFMRKEPDRDLPVAVNKTADTEKAHVKPENVTPIETVEPQHQTMKKIEAALPSIAELAATRKKPMQELQATEPVAVKKPDQPRIEQVQPTVEPKFIEETQLEPAEVVEKKPVAVSGHKSIPFLYELPSEFRRTLPDLQINVFVYSEQAADRFVMIDMVKYTVGQRIKDVIALKEIRSDSLVLEYNDRTFRIKRP